jgi:16S rRNA (guanine966-N2)-methyltransferase
VLDLYAGTGALGLEALSRGARRPGVVAPEHPAPGVLRRELGLEDRSSVIGAEVCSALRRLAANGEHFSWVFLDPPYAKETEGVLAELSGGDLLASCAVVIVEHDRRHRPSASVGGLFVTDRRQYGDTELSFFRGSDS